MEKNLNSDVFMIELNPYIILSKPQLGENIGSTARAMKNFGIKNLLLVQPRDCLLYTSPSPRDPTKSRMPSSA